jgi:hypothetical protein
MPNPKRERSTLADKPERSADESVGISVFLSYPKPFTSAQEEFVTRVKSHLRDRGFAPRTLGVTDYDIDAPLTAIRRLMLECNGLITIAFRRTYVERGTSRQRTDLAGLRAQPFNKQWLTTPWAHIEPAMAYQIGLPILIFRELGVFADGVLEKGVVGLYMPEFESDKAEAYFASLEWRGVIARWDGYVRSVVDNKGRPPRLF